MVLSGAELEEYASYVQYALVHKYTRSAVAPAASDDDWKMKAPTYPVVVVDIVCNYLASGSLSTRLEGIQQVDDPSIMVAKEDTIKVGDRVTNIKDSNGVIVHPGPLYVQYVAPAMGFGPVTNYIATLAGTAPKQW